MTGHVVVTGSSGGIGSAISRMLVDAGWIVTGFDRCVGDSRVPTVEVDLTVPGAAYRAISTLNETLPVTAIVHAAAIQQLSRVGQIDTADWHASFQVNVVAVDELVAGCRQSLIDSNGSVVVLSSVHAEASTAGMATYSTTKAALSGWVRAAALDLAPHVRVNAVQPGAVMTPMLVAGLSRRPGMGRDESLEALSRSTPMQSIGDPSDIAEAVKFLVDRDKSRFMTGSTLRVDGGALLGLATE